MNKLNRLKEVEIKQFKYIVLQFLKPNTTHLEWKKMFFFLERKKTFALGYWIKFDNDLDFILR